MNPRRIGRVMAAVGLGLLVTVVVIAFTSGRAPGVSDDLRAGLITFAGAGAAMFIWRTALARLFDADKSAADAFRTGAGFTWVGLWLVAAGLLIAADRGRGVLLGLTVDLPTGLPSLAAFMIIVAVASMVHLGFPGLRVPWFWGIAVLAGGIALIELPRSIGSAGEDHLASLAWPVRVALVAGLGIVFLKLIVLERYAAMARSRLNWSPAREAEELARLLPCQAEDLHRLAAAVNRQLPEQDARVVQVRGRWGDGKSFILQRLGAQLNLQHRIAGERAAPAVVTVDIWKHESEPDLHLAIFEQVLGTRCFLAHGGWLGYPALALIGRYLPLVWQLSYRAKTGLGLDTSIKVPRLPWQGPLERLVGYQRRRGRIVVILLDEIDRAAPTMAQAAVTMIKRSLDLPGVVVVMSYVIESMRYKVFNPLCVDVLPDLASTMEAVIYAEGIDRDPSRIPSPAPGSIYDWWTNWGDLKLSEVAQHVSGSTASSSGHAPAGSEKAMASETHGPEPGRHRSSNGAETLSVRVRRAYEGAAVPTRIALQNQFAERYLQTPGHIAVTRLSFADIADMVVQFDSLRELSRSAGDPDPAVNRQAIEQGLARWARVNGLSANDSAPVRQIEGWCAKILDGVAKTGGGGSAGLLAASVVTAWQLARQ